MTASTLLAQPDTEFRVVAALEYDDPSPQAALDGVRQFRLAGIAGLVDVELVESVPSEDDTVLNDQHHIVYATFIVRAADDVAAANWMAAALREVAPQDAIDGIAVNGDWFPEHL